MAITTNVPDPRDPREDNYQARYDAAKPTNQRELLEHSSHFKVEETKLTPTMVHKLAEDAEYFGNVATRLNAAAYRHSTELLPFTPGELHAIANVAKILRTKGVELGDAMAAGIVRRAVRSLGDPSKPLSKE